jgi:hypothetical protein
MQIFSITLNGMSKFLFLMFDGFNKIKKNLRFRTQWETGYVTCFHQEELGILKDLLKRTPDDILHAGLHPTYDQVYNNALYLIVHQQNIIFLSFR